MATDVNPYAAPQADVDRLAEGDEVEPVTVFSFSGRLGRVRYLAYLMGAYLILLVVFGFIVGATIGMRGGTRNSIGNLTTGLMVLAYLTMLVAVITLAVRRLHDFEASGWWVLFLLIPFVNFFFGLFLLFKPGSDGRNRFGGRTPPNSVGVVILASVMPAVAVLGIVAAIALPAYQGYVKRSQGMGQVR